MKDFLKNKKKMLIFITTLIILVIAVICVIMFFSESELLSGNKASKIVTAVANNKYYMKMIQLDDDMDETGEVAEFTKKDDDYVLSVMGYSIIVKDDDCYFVSTKEKTVLKGSKEDIGTTLQEPALLSETMSVDNPEISTKTIKDKEYYCEQYNDIIMYFDSNDNIAYITNEGNTIKILEFDNKTKEELFKVPSDYKVVTEADLNNQ